MCFQSNGYSGLHTSERIHVHHRNESYTRAVKGTYHPITNYWQYETCHRPSIDWPLVWDPSHRGQRQIWKMLWHSPSDFRFFLLLLPSSILGLGLVIEPLFGAIWDSLGFFGILFLYLCSEVFEMVANWILRDASESSQLPDVWLDGILRDLCGLFSRNDSLVSLNHVSWGFIIIDDLYYLWICQMENIISILRSLVWYLGNRTFNHWVEKLTVCSSIQTQLKRSGSVRPKVVSEQVK